MHSPPSFASRDVLSFAQRNQLLNGADFFKQTRTTTTRSGGALLIYKIYWIVYRVGLKMNYVNKFDCEKIILRRDQQNNFYIAGSETSLTKLERAL